MKRILLLTTEPLPLPGLPATGAGLRAWGLAQGLRAAGFAVKLMFPSNAAATYAGNAPVEKNNWPDWVDTFDRPAVNDAIRRENPDAVVLQHWGMAHEIADLGIPLAIDLAGPHLLERKLWGSPDPEADLREKLAALRRADFLVCSGERQRLYFLPFLMMAGWPIDNPATLPVIPYSFEPLEPAARVRNDRFLYGGFLLPWQDPTVIIEETLSALDRAGRGELLFIGGPHPTLDVSRGRFEPLLAKLKSHPRAKIVPPMSFDDFRKTLAEGGVALDLMARNAERELAFTSRTVIYLAAGLPVIHDDYSELSALIEEFNAGWTIDPSDRASVSKLLDRILGGGADLNEMAAGARRLIDQKLNQRRTAAPLAEWCNNPQMRAEKIQHRLQFEEQGNRLARAENDLRQATSELQTLKGKRWIKWGLNLFAPRGPARYPLALIVLVTGILLVPIFFISDLAAKIKLGRS